MNAEGFSLMGFARLAFIQLRFLIRRWPSIITFIALTAIMLMNFIYNVNEFRGLDTLMMFQPMRMLTLSYDMSIYNSAGILFVPVALSVLSSVPAGLSYAADRQIGESMEITVRTGSKRYYRTRLAAVFMTTLIVFSAPFLIEIVLNCLSFPLGANGNFMQKSYYDPEMIAEIKSYLFGGLCLASPYLYAVICTLLFGCFAAFLACFTYALSLIVYFKFRVFYLLPVFVFAQISGMLYANVSGRISSLSYINYVFMYNMEGKNIFIFIAFLCAIAAFCVFSVRRAEKKDVLQ